MRAVITTLCGVGMGLSLYAGVPLLGEGAREYVATTMPTPETSPSVPVMREQQQEIAQVKVGVGVGFVALGGTFLGMAAAASSRPEDEGY